MSANPKSHPSFSAGRRFNSALHAGFGMLAIAALVVMANYLATRHSLRWFLSARSEFRLSPQTLGLLRTLTNQINVTVFYDQRDPYFSMVTGLLREYQRANLGLRVNVVDYMRDNVAAQRVSATYHLAGLTNKNRIIFDCAGVSLPVPGDALMLHKIGVVDAKDRKFERKPVAFYGEIAFSHALLAVTSKPLKAYALTGHNEHTFDSTAQVQGYSQFTAALLLNRIETVPLSLADTNAVPDDCNVLIVPGPLRPIPDAELEKVEQYLGQGGRLLALLNSFGNPRECGLERVLAKWGVAITTNPVVDLRNTKLRGHDLMTADFAAHEAVRPLAEAARKNEAALHLISPRGVGRLESALKTADAPTVEVLVRSAPSATLDGHAGVFPLAVAVEKGAVKGVVTQRGTTRIVVVGDSFFLGNEMVRSASNQDFAACAANWLLDRSQLLFGLGPRRVDEFRLTLSQAQVQTLQWLLLGGLPGAVLAFGGLVWLKRRS